jgi:hypothetical protein
MNRWISGATAVGLAVVSGCGSSKSPGPAASPASSFQTLSATQILAAAKADGAAKKSVHVTATGTLDGQRMQGELDAAASTGRSTLRIGAHTLEQALVAGVAYARADEVALEEVVGLPAAQARAYAGKWIAFRRGDKSYADATEGLTLRSGLADELDVTQAVKLNVNTVNGVQTVGISGKAPTGEPETVYISLTAPHLPLEARTGTPGSLITETFGQWGEDVNVSAPADSVRLPG